MTLRKAHRVLGGVVALFIVLHLANHASVFWGAQHHLQFQNSLRPIYRNPIVEPLLVLAFMAQTLFGIRLLLRRGWPRRTWARVQSVSGGVLALFLVQHIAAALLTRTFKPEIETNVYWAAAVVSRPEFAVYFAPYYVLGVFSLFLHLAAYLALRQNTSAAAVSVGVFGAAFSMALVAALAGVLIEIDLPQPYSDYLDDYWF